MGKEKRVSLRDIAEKVPCSSSTVSIVLKGKGDQYRISESTQSTIKRLATEMGYMGKSRPAPPSRPAPSFISIAIFLGLQNSVPIYDMLKGISMYPEHNGKMIEYSLHPYVPTRLHDLEANLTGNKYDGLIILPTSRADSAYLKSIKITVPNVVMTASVPGYNSVTSDRIACGAMVADLFIAKGHKNVGLVTRNTFTDSGRLRAFGFTSAYDEAGITDAKITVIEDKTDGDYGYASMNELLDTTAGDPPTAIFVTEPNNFSGTISSLREHGKSVPRDFDLVIFGSYSDNVVHRCISPSITTVGYPVDEMMYDCIDLICHQLDGGILHGVTKLHSSRFVFRDSCSPPKDWTPRDF